MTRDPKRVLCMGSRVDPKVAVVDGLGLLLLLRVISLGLFGLKDVLVLRCVCHYVCTIASHNSNKNYFTTLEIRQN